jgi:hypothetical protein
MVWKSARSPGKWQACWEDGTPLRGDNDETSYFDSAAEAIKALSEGGGRK